MNDLNRESIEKCTAEAVVKKFNDFLKTYNRFRKDNGLIKPVGNIFEICTSMTDKHGRICREIKHFQRKDPKKDWPQGVVEAFCGYIVYMIMVLEKYGISIEQGMINELESARKQYANKE